MDDTDSIKKDFDAILNSIKSRSQENEDIYDIFDFLLYFIPLITERYNYNTLSDLTTKRIVLEKILIVFSRLADYIFSFESVIKSNEHIRKCLTNVQTKLPKFETNIEPFDKITISLMADVNIDENQQVDFINDTAKKAIVLIKARSSKGESIGTGFNIRKDGKILTVAHVVHRASEIKVRFTEDERLKDKEYNAQIIYQDKAADIALLQIMGFDKGEVLHLASPQYKVLTSMKVGLLGYPLSSELSDGVTYTGGSVGNSDRRLGSVVKAYQIDAGAYSGSSGGPLIDLKTGKVIGILGGGIYDESSGKPIRLGFINLAIAIEEVYTRIINIDEQIEVTGIRFTDNGDGTITDNKTRLMWTKDASTPSIGSCKGGKMTWADANKYIKCLNDVKYLGYSDWMLPTKDQLTSLIIGAGDNKPYVWLAEQGFTNIYASWYWSSTAVALYTDYAWYVNMGYGFVSYDSKGYDSNHAWPVRLGQSVI